MQGRGQGSSGPGYSDGPWGLHWVGAEVGHEQRNDHQRCSGRQQLEGLDGGQFLFGGVLVGLPHGAAPIVLQGRTPSGPEN